MQKEERPLLGSYQKIDLGKINRNTAARLMCFLLCIGILTAAFVVSSVWMDRRRWFGNGELGVENAETPSLGDPSSPSNPPSAADTNEKTEEKLELPADAVPVVSMDLSAEWSIGGMVENQTAYRLNMDELLSMPLFGGEMTDAPLVLILHTHTAEAYMESGASYVTGEIGDAIYSDQADRSVLAVGKALCDVLNQNGVSAVHCAQKHGMDGSLQNAYAFSEACIKAYLKRYPSIRYVIDLHRDGILDRSGALVRTDVQKEGERYCQVMAVVGSDGNGTKHPNWRGNLALALQLCGRLNGSVEGMSRSVSLRNASYNQELAPYSLLLEIGSAGNTQAEAIRTAQLVGLELSSMIKEAIVS